MNKQKDRLVELIGSKVCEEYSPNCDEYEPHTCEKCYANFCKVGDLADAILADGWMRPPCKVGDTVYEVDLPEYGIIVCKVTKVLYDSEEVIINVIDGHGKGSEYYFEFDDFGKTVSLTKEEAEAKLKEGVQGC